MKKGQWVHILQMVLTAPGRELYLEAGRLKEKPEWVRAILLIFLLPVLAVLLWAIRKNIYVLIFGGGSMAVGFFYIYFMLYEKRMKILDFLARLFEPFYKVFEKHRKAAGWGSISDDKSAKAGKTGAAGAGSTAGQGGDEKSRGEDEYFRRWKEAAGRAKEAKQREWERRKRNYERRHAQNGSNGEGTKENYRKEDNTAKKPAADRAREEAETIFMVKYPYDEAEIKSKRNMLLKKYHPDNAEGSEEMCKKINECYAVLMKYCG